MSIFKMFAAYCQSKGVSLQWWIVKLYEKVDGSVEQGCVNEREEHLQTEN